MMRGRPRKPEPLKAEEGFRGHRTRAELFARLGAASEATKGRPPLPAALRTTKADDPQTRQRLKWAREHWSYLLEELEREGRLYQMDGGVLSSMALLFAGVIESGRAGDWNNAEKISAKYLQCADRVGLHAAARSKLPQQAKPAISALESDLCA